MYKECPDCEEKEYIRELIAQECIFLNAKNVFTLVGTKAGMASKLPKNINIYSAEKDKKIIRKQRKMFPDYNHTYGDASRVLSKYYDYFDVIWLDYFSGMNSYCNRASYMLALLALKKEGTLFITSSFRNNNDEIIKQMLSFVNVIQEFKYNKSRGWMKVFKIKL